MIKVGSEFIWLWVAIEPWNKRILGFDISKERNMFVAEKFIAGLTKVYDKHSVSTDGGNMVSITSLSVFKTKPSYSFPFLRKAL